MKLEGFKVKERLGFDEIVRMCNVIADSAFGTDDDGEKRYSPYMIRYARISAFFALCTEGLELDESESYYDCYMNSPELQNAYASATYGGELADQLIFIDDCVEKMVDFEKDHLIHEHKDSLSELLDTLNKKLEALDFEKTFAPEAIVSAYMKSEERKKKEAEIIDSKNDAIRKLRKMLEGK